jgi:thymidylate kinase
MKNVFEKLGYQASIENSEKSISLLYINNPDGTIRWAWNASCKKPLFLKFYNIGSFRAGVFAFALRLIFTLRLQKIVFHKKKYFFSTISEPLFDYKKDWAIFMGTVGPNNKAVLYVDSLFYKIAMTPIAQKLIAKECVVLQQLTLKNVDFTFPKVQVISKDVIELTDVSDNGIRTNTINTSHLKALLAMSVIECKTVTIKEWSLWRNLTADFDNCNDKRIPVNIVRKINVLKKSILLQDSLQVSLSHGDFTQWNLYEIEGKLAIYDWELAHFEMPIGFDYFHFIIQQGVLVEHKTWKQIYDDILLCFKNAIGLQLFKTESDLINALKWYLLVNCMHYINVYAAQPKWHVQVHWLFQIWGEAFDMFLKNDFSSRELVLMDLFDYLHNKEYAALKFQNEPPEKLSIYSDIDLVIPKKQDELLVRFLKSHHLVSRIVASKKSFMNSMQVFINDDSVLSLDLIWQIKVKNLQILDATVVIEKHYSNKFGVRNASNIDTARFLVLFYSLNSGEIPEKYLDYLDCLKDSREPLDVKIKGFLKNNRNSKNKILKFIRKNPNNRFLNFLKNTFYYCFDTLKSMFTSKGFTITFSGVDGAGKSTVIEAIAFRVDKRLRKKVVVLRHRPSVLPILSVWTKGKEKAHFEATVRLPRLGNNKSLISSLLRFGYYYLDYFFGQFVIYFKYILRGYVVIYDRYYFDYINDSKRSNIVLPKWIAMLGYRFLLKPEFNFFLFADATIILERKKELDEATIQSLTREYSELFDHLAKKNKRSIYKSINNIIIEDTLDTIISTIITTNHEKNH